MRLLRSSVKTLPNQVKTAPVGRELAVIDGALQDWEQLAQGVRPGVETAILDPSRDGIVQIAEILSRSAANDRYTALHIVGHAEPGSLQLGTARLNRETLSRYAWDLQLWQKLLLPTREKGKSDLFPMPNAQCPMPHSLLIYGCSFAAGETGQNFLRVLGELTGANIAASSSPVGSRAKGGNWNLDTAIGDISIALAFSPELQQDYAGVFATYNVTSTADALTGGTLREAIIAANATPAADTIVLPAGTITLTIGGTGEDAAATGDLDITSDITIQGNGATINANSIDRVLQVLDSGSLALENATITGGTAGAGGGIYNRGTLAVTNSTISGNSTTSSSGIAQGGGINSSSTLTVINSTISGNSATGAQGGLGGGINSGSTATVINSTISGNSATGTATTGSAGGGGIYNSSNSTLTVINSTISGNAAAAITAQGGGIYNYGTFTVTNSTISGNSATGTTAQGGGIYNRYTGPLTANNSIISGNTATTDPDVYGIFSGNNNVIGNLGSASGFTGTIAAAANTVINTTLANNGGPTQTHALIVNSPAIDAGNNAAAAALTTDQRGFTRIFNGTVDIGAYEAQPEIDIQGSGSTSIASGDITPATTDGTDFGSINVVGSSSTSTFSILNTSGALFDLTPTGVTITGAPDFTVTTNPGSSVTPGNSTTFQITFDPTVAGVRTAIISIANNDPDENPYTFVIQGTGIATPEIQVLDGSTDIADGTTTALDFGNATVGGTLNKNFTINNLGSATLNLSNLSLPTGFTGTLPTSVAAGGNATFTVNADTSAVASLSGTLQFTTDDSDENPFNFPISAAIAADPAPEIQVLDGSTDIADSTTTVQDFGSTTVGGTLSNTFTINNLGSATLNLSGLTLPTGFTGTLPTSVAAGGNATFTVNADTSAVASLSGTLQFTTNDSDENPFNFPISAAIAADPAPEIQVLDGSTDIADGTTTALDFGNATVGGTLSNSFTINNLGTATLNLSNLSLPTGFSGTLPTSVAAGGSETFTVNVDTATAGILSGTLQFTTDDSNENLFDFPISAAIAAAPAPEIQVLDGSTGIADNTTTALDFGKTTTGGTLSNTFTINNLGSATLNLSNLNLPTGFSGTLPTSVAAGGSETFTVNVDTSAVASYIGILQFTTDDSNENPFDVAIFAEVTATPEPEIQVLDGSSGIADGTTTALDFGNTTVGGNLNKTFTINNLGSAALNLSSLSLPTGFSLGGTFPATIAAGGSGTFIINVDTAAAGNFSGTLSFATNDSDENLFDFPISAEVTAATDIQVLDGGNAIADGTTTTVGFGSVDAGGTLSKTFTVNNTGTTDLSLSNLSLPTGFNLGGTLPATVAAGGSATFTINVDTTSTGIFAGVLQFQNSDRDSNPFDFPISARVNVGPVVIPDDNLQIPPTTEPVNDSGDTTGGGTGDIIDCTCPPIPEFPLVSFNFGEPNPARAGDDTLIGTQSDNFLAGSTGNDWIAGLGGNDILIGGNGSLNSGSDNDSDILFGNAGFDLLQGSSGNDTIYAGKDNDIARGDNDGDLIYGDLGNDTLMGDLGNDSIFGGTSDPIVADANGQDLLSGGAGNDFMNGNQGNDSLSGGLGNDTVRGGQDDDLLHGDSGDDIIYGDNGADHLCGGDGNDSLFGGVGNDAGIGATGQQDTLCGGAGNDFLNGNEGQDKLDGGTGDDTLRGGKDSDTILGGEGSDVIWGDLGNDSLSGGAGSDIFVLSADSGSDIVTDFSDGIDRIGLSAGLTFAQLTVSAGANGADVFLGAELLATFASVDNNQITESDFVVV